MTAKVLIIGASGRVGSQVVEALREVPGEVIIRLASSRAETVSSWSDEGHEAVLLDLDEPGTFADALNGVDRVFLLTGYTADMLYQSKMLVDAAKEAKVSHIVHLGVFTSRADAIPHFNWHDLVESYIESSGIAWTHIHPNVIADSILVTQPSIKDTGSFSVFFDDMPQGWVFVKDIAEVAAAVLREGPHKHNAKEYWLSTEVLTGPQVAAKLSGVAGKEIKCDVQSPNFLEEQIKNIPSASVRAYMESAVITMKLASAGKMPQQVVVHDDVLKVLGRPGTTVEAWGREYFS